MILRHRHRRDRGHQRDRNADDAVAQVCHGASILKRFRPHKVAGKCLKDGCALHQARRSPAKLRVMASALRELHDAGASRGL
jgi:hypothetical protein